MVRPKDLREQAQSAAPPEVDLEESITSRLKSLRDKRVETCIGVYVRDAPSIYQNFNVALKTCDLIFVGLCVGWVNAHM
jgi:hypothetical protein